ncbi:MAG: YceI family protein [Acidobacteria bacterium]|nr:YceI family protein [Acidobacteriota bacterium]
MIARSTLAALAFVAFASPVAAQTWTIDPAHSGASFTVRHMMVSNVHGRFGKVEGTIVYDGSNIGGVSATANIASTTITTDNEKRDAHLKSADFFDVAAYPTITFKSKRAEVVGNGRFKLIGDLTMRGKTKEVVLDVEGPTDPVTVQNSQRIGATATTTINRQDFGVSWSRSMDGGGVVVGDSVKITIELELIKQNS